MANKRLRLGLIQQDVYLRDSRAAVDLKSSLCDSVYSSLEEVVLPDGSRKEVLVERDYPITRDSVNSYADSCNYRLDMDRALSAPPRGVNIPDPAAVSRLLSMSPDEFKSAFSAVLQKLDNPNVVKDDISNEVKSDV